MKRFQSVWRYTLGTESDTCNWANTVLPIPENGCAVYGISTSNTSFGDAAGVWTKIRGTVENLTLGKGRFLPAQVLHVRKVRACTGNSGNWAGTTVECRKNWQPQEAIPAAICLTAPAIRSFVRCVLQDGKSGVPG